MCSEELIVHSQSLWGQNLQRDFSSCKAVFPSILLSGIKRQVLQYNQFRTMSSEYLIGRAELSVSVYIEIGQEF
jgi:hypothetical protein